jgi:hypothetical protein
VRSSFFSAPTFVHFHVLVCVNRQWTVRVDCDQKQAGVSLPMAKSDHRASFLRDHSGQLTYIRSAWYRECRLCTTDASFKWVSSAISSALSNFAGLTLSTWSASTSRCCHGDEREFLYELDGLRVVIPLHLHSGPTISHLLFLLEPDHEQMLSRGDVTRRICSLRSHCLLPDLGSHPPLVVVLLT